MDTDFARNSYLQIDWVPYPTRPASHGIAGRIIALNQNQVTIQLQPGEEQSFQIPPDWGPRLRVGDWLSAELSPELGSLQLRELCLLAPALSHSESQARSRKLAQSKRDHLLRWSQFLSYVRDFFSQQGFLEIQTPSLVTCPGTEPYLDVFATEFVNGRQKRTLFLPTSPEIHLKKALAMGFPQIFEIRSCFRNGEISQTHQPEFTMLEWYRHYANLDAIREDVEKLVEFLIRKFQISSVDLPFSNKSIEALFKECCDFKLTPQTSAEELRRLAAEVQIKVGLSSEFDDLFFHLFLEKIEPTLAQAGPIFVCDYPPSQAALARLTKEGWGDRFEFYWKGLEIANAFHELNDPKIQRQRSFADLELKVKLGKGKVPLDEDFFVALEQGMPPSAGIALGLERLFMALFDIKEIEQFRLFPLGT